MRKPPSSSRVSRALPHRRIKRENGRIDTIIRATAIRETDGRLYARSLDQSINQSVRKNRHAKFAAATSPPLQFRRMPPPVHRASPLPRSQARDFSRADRRSRARSIDRSIGHIRQLSVESRVSSRCAKHALGICVRGSYCVWRYILFPRLFRYLIYDKYIARARARETSA